MWHKLFLLSIGMIMLVTITGVVFAQGDYKTLSRVQMDDWCTKYAPDHDNPPKRGIQLDNVPNQNVNNWGCLDYDGKLHGISFTDMCRFYYGDSYADAKYWDYNNPDSWYCNHVNAPAPTAIPPQPTPVPQPQQPSGGNAGGSNPSQQPTNVPQQPSGGDGGQQPSGNTDCPSVGSRLSPGDSAWVSDSDPYSLNVRSAASKSAPVIFQIPIRETVTVQGSPTCGDGYLWIVITYQGKTGWAAEINKDGSYNLNPGVYGGGSSGGNGAGISIPITLPGGISFSLQVVYDASSCVIQNGAELTIMEIQNLQNQLNGKSMDDKVAIVTAYLMPDSGIVEQIRHNVESAIGGLSQSCNPNGARYQIGNQLMDLSGPGNIVFGYVMGAWGWPLFVEDQISNTDQTIRDFGRKLSLRDEPDDICQREVGRALAAGGRVDAINAGLLSDEIGRSCTLDQ